MMDVDRPDLVRGMLQSAYIIEKARSRLQAAWGGAFQRDAEHAGQRADRVGALLDALALARREDVVPAHTQWLESYAGSFPTHVPLGAAVLHQLGKWSDAFASSFLGDDAQDFVALGREHTRVDADRRAMTEDEAVLPDPELPPGRRFVILTDVHVGSRGRDALARIAVDEINALEPEFVVVPGDFTDDGEPEQFHMAKEILDGLRCPYHVVMGNHDAVQRSTGGGFGTTFFADTFGVPPDDHVIECGDLQVALVDTTDPTQSPFPDPDPAQTGRAGGVDSGALRPGQARALAGRLDTRRPLLLVQHHELQPFPGFPPVKFALRDEDAAGELDALSVHNLIGVVAGHTHRSAALPVGDGSSMQLEVPSLKDWPHAYTVAGVSDEGVRLVVRQLADKAAVWRMSRNTLSLMRRFHVGGPWAAPTHTFSL